MILHSNRQSLTRDINPSSKDLRHGVREGETARGASWKLEKKSAKSAKYWRKRERPSKTTRRTKPVEKRMKTA
jgi:hypothetical protein